MKDTVASYTQGLVYFVEGKSESRIFVVYSVIMMKLLLMYIPFHLLVACCQLAMVQVRELFPTLLLFLPQCPQAVHSHDCPLVEHRK